MAGTKKRQFTRREFAALFVGVMAFGNASAARAALDPAEDYVDRIAGEVMERFAAMYSSPNSPMS